jgi:hypothetical protein
MVVAIVSPLENESDFGFENMNIVIQNISELPPISLTDLVNANVEGMKVGFESFEIVKPMKEIIVDGKPAISFVFTGMIGGVNQKDLQVYTIKGDIVYTLTFSAVPETYSTYEPIFEKMVQSFRISN